MDRFKVREVQCSECQTLQQVSEDYSPSLPAVAGPTRPGSTGSGRVCVFIWCLLLLFKGTADL